MDSIKIDGTKVNEHFKGLFDEAHKQIKTIIDNLQEKIDNYSPFMVDEGNKDERTQPFDNIMVKEEATHHRKMMT